MCVIPSFPSVMVLMLSWGPASLNGEGSDPSGYSMEEAQEVERVNEGR